MKRALALMVAVGLLAASTASAAMLPAGFSPGFKQVAAFRGALFDVGSSLRGSGGGSATSVTPGTTTVTGCQNLVLFGDNSQTINCDTDFGFASDTITLGAAVRLNTGNGTAAAPAIAWAADADGTGSGWFRSAANAWGWSDNGVERFRLGASARVTTLGDFVIGANFGGTGVILQREGTDGVLQLGQDLNGSVVAQVVKAHDGITGTDVAGAPMTLATGRGTGAAVAPDLVFQSSTPIATGTTAQTLVTRHHIEGSLRALTDATATTVFTVTTGNDLSCGGTMFFTVEAADAANQQTTSGSVNFSASDNAAGDGGEACAAAVTGTNASATTSGTLTVTADATDGGADLCNIRLTATGSLTETVGPRVRYSIVFNPTSSTCAVNPQ